MDVEGGQAIGAGPIAGLGEFRRNAGGSGSALYFGRGSPGASGRFVATTSDQLGASTEARDWVYRTWAIVDHDIAAAPRPTAICSRRRDPSGRGCC